MATSIPRPGVEVIQQLSSVSPTVARPQLVPCIVGPNFEILDLLDSSGAVNSNGLVSTPASITGTTTADPKAASGLSIVVSVNSGADITSTLPTSSSGNLTAAIIATFFENEDELPGVKVENVSGAIRFTTTMSGDGASLEFKAGGTANAVLGLTAGIKVNGASRYANQDINIPFNRLPAERGDVDQMVFDAENLFVYRLQNGVLRLFEDDASTLMNRFHRFMVSAGAPTSSRASATWGTVGANDALTIVTNPTAALPNGSQVTITWANAAPGIVVTGQHIAFSDDFSGGGGTLPPNDIVAAIEASAGTGNDAAALVTAYAHGTGAAAVGAGAGEIRNLAVLGVLQRLTPVPLMQSPAGRIAMTGQTINDNDSDAVSPLFAAPGGVATVATGAGATGLSFTARGLSNPITDGDSDVFGNFHGDAGNAFSVVLDDIGQANVLATVAGITGGANVMTVNYDGPVGTSTDDAAAIAAAVNADAFWGSRIQCQVTGVGTGSPTAVAEVNLIGGFDPLGFAPADGDEAVVTGERTSAHFGYIRVTGSFSAAFEPGEQVDAPGPLKVGTCREHDTINGILWLDPDTPAAVVAVANVLTGASSGSTVTVTTVTQEGVEAGDTLTIQFDTRGNPPDTSAGPEIVVTFAGTETTLELVRAAIDAAIDVVYPAAGATAALLVSGAGAVVAPETDPRTTLRIDAVGIVTTHIDYRPGIESTIKLGGTAVEKVFGLMGGGSTYAGTHEGAPFPVVVGDELWNGTSLLGTIVELQTLTIGSQTFANSQLKIDTDTLAITGSSSSFSQWWVKAKGITTTAGLPVPATRPMPEAVIDGTNEMVFIQANQARSSDGTLPSNPSFAMYATYTALRTDTSAIGTNAALSVFETTTELDSLIGPIDPDNPLCYAMYLAMLNATSVQVSGLAVAATSANEPDGTVLAYTAATEFLESEEVYALAPLSRARDVHDVFASHVAAMSGATLKKERIVFLNHEIPTESEAELAGSGTGTNSSTNVITIDAATLDLGSAVLAAGVDPTGSWSDFKDAGLYVEVTTTAGKWSVSSIVGQVLTVAAGGFDPGENDDLFYSTTALNPATSPPLMAAGGETVTIKVRGAAIDATTTAGRNLQAAAMSAIASSYNSRRVYWVQPDQIGVTYLGSEVLVEGYFACAAICGMVAQQLPSQGFTNLPMVGFTRPVGSNDRFSTTQMDSAAGGGVYWIVQDSPGGAIKARHQLSTNTSTVEFRELSITKALDFGAKFLRNSLKGFIGQYNVSDEFLDTLSIVTQGVLHFLVDGAIWRDADINNLIQDETSPDLVLLDISVVPLFPANTIRVTLVV